MRPAESTSFHCCLRRVLENPAQNWKTIPLKYQKDKRFVVQVVELAKELPAKSDLERAFPQSYVLIATWFWRFADAPILNRSTKIVIYLFRDV